MNTVAKDEQLVENIADLLALSPTGMSVADVASSLDERLTRVRVELLQLEKLGLVVRSGRTRGTRWHLG